MWQPRARFTTRPRWGARVSTTGRVPRPMLKWCTNYHHPMGTTSLAVNMSLQEIPWALAATTFVFLSIAILFQSPARAILRATSACHANLTIPVSRLTGPNVVLIICLIAFKYPLRWIGAVPQLRSTASGFDLPHLTITSEIDVGDEDRKRYDRAVPGGGDRALLLAGLINPLMSIMLTNRNNPIMPFGCVNTKNRFEFLDTEPPSGHYTVTATLGGDENPARRVKRGIELDVVFVASHAQRGRVFRQVATILAYLPSKHKPLYKAPQEGKTVEKTASEWKNIDTDTVELKFNAPFDWAAVCKDYNPIHMSSGMAKLFGFPSKIAHGNHVLASFVQKFGNSPPDPFAIDVDFKRPMRLPLSMAVEHSRETTTSERFRVVKDGKEYMTASRTVL